MAVSVFEFGAFKLDCDRFELSRAGRGLRLERKPMELLILLVAANGHLVTRAEIVKRLWDSEVFVDTEHGINTAIRKIRQALGDDPEDPHFVQTVTGKGYRFIAGVEAVELKGAESVGEEKPTDSHVEGPSDREHAAPVTDPRKGIAAYITAGVCALLAVAGIAAYRSFHFRPGKVTYTQLTDFTDSAVSPALSPDGRMLAFIRGSDTFLSADQIYVKLLPNGEARRLTDDGRPKYGLAFSPDGSEIAYGVLDPPNFSTYTVSILGGDSHLLLRNAAGLSWLDKTQLLYSEIPTGSGIHLGVVTGTALSTGIREVYFPPHERGMAHYSYASPDRHWALVVEMDATGAWAACRLVSLDRGSPPRTIGPNGACTSAGWSPDGAWMYFTAALAGSSHIWRQRFPNGAPEQITFGPTEEDGLAVEHIGRSLITSVGVHESAIWIHDAGSDRQLSSEGEAVVGLSPPSFSQNDKILYYLLRHGPEGSGAELWRTEVESGKSEAVFPGVSMFSFDVSPDGTQVVYSTATPDGKPQFWLAPMDRGTPAKRVGDIEGVSPHFGSRGQILFQRSEGNSNYLEQVNSDGSGRSRVVPYPIVEIQGISPGRRWIVATVPKSPDRGGPAVVAISLDGGPPRRVCATYCNPVWSSNGKFLFIQVEGASREGPGRSLAIPLGSGETLRALPPEGVEPMAEASSIPGSVSVPRAYFVPGADPTHFAYVNTTVHRNLYRISLP
jgi:DNA-binding winged helix-turn-helix (wHTH) protein/Tol biopolymer transport system component